MIETVILVFRLHVLTDQRLYTINFKYL